MPQFEPLVLKDRADPQVEHTFNPRGIDQGIATLVESTGIPIGDVSITLSQNRASKGNSRVRLVFKRPVVATEVVSGVSVPTVVRTLTADLTFVFPDTSTLQERDDMVSYVNEALKWTDNEMLGGYIVNLEGLF
jgi:hypothetical protein